ncbi:MAG: hypothetical protein M1812_002784 [Candelaria pacifica]|nr:MAG: hypothetical protein M1812_002784 [Candelaria pacifica]
MESFKAFFQKALRGENGYVSLIREPDSDGDDLEQHSHEASGNDEADDAFENTPLVATQVLQDPTHSNGTIASRRMKGNKASYTERAGTEWKVNTVTDAISLHTTSVQAQPRRLVVDSSEEAARLYALSKIDIYTPWAPICQYQTPEACARARAEGYLRSSSSAASDAGSKAAAYAHAKTLTSCAEKVHYTIIRSKGMKFELGDCQYLDKCLEKNAGCTKVHYLKVSPKLELAVIGVWILKATKFENDPDSFDTLSRALKKHELKKLVALQKLWAALGPSIPSVLADEKLEPLAPRSIDVDVRELNFAVLGKFGVVMVNAPAPSHESPPCDTISKAELCNLPLEILSNEGLLFLWGTADDIGSTCIENWGYRVVTRLTWIKANKLSKKIISGRTGHWLNQARETCLIGFKGQLPSPYTALLDKDTETVVAPEEDPAYKPDEVYDMIDRFAGVETRKVELFGRVVNLRKGWLTVGHQVASAERKPADTEGEAVMSTGNDR